MSKSYLSQYKQNKLIELFVADITARTAAELINVNKAPQPIISIVCDCLSIKTVYILRGSIFKNK